MPHAPRLLVDEGQQAAERRRSWREWHPYTLPIITEQAGKVGVLSTSSRASRWSSAMTEVTGLTSKAAGRLQAGGGRCRFAAASALEHQKN